MSNIIEKLSYISRIISDITTIVAPLKMPDTHIPMTIELSGKAGDGRLLRDMMSMIIKDVDSILSDNDIRAEAYGLSGTKNELLRDKFNELATAVKSLEAAIHEYLRRLIDSFVDEVVTQSEINDLLRSGDLVTDGVVDDVALHKLRVFTHNNPQADYRSYISRQLAILGGHGDKHVLRPINQYGLIQKSILDGFVPPDDRSGKPVKGYDAVYAIIASSSKNIIVIHLTYSGHEYFRAVSPAAGDVTKPIDADFISRMTSIVSVTAPQGPPQHILHIPHRGKLTSVYITYDYETFFFMTPGFDASLTAYHDAIGYYSAMTGNLHEDTPRPSHETYNDRANAIFADRWYRHDLVVLATSFKPGAGLSDALKSHIRDGFLRRIKDMAADKIVPREVIYDAIHRVLPDGSRESRISSYLAADRLVFIFSKEYEAEIKKVEWSTYQEVTMMGVIAEVIKKCDKMNVWTIDFKSLKDLF